MQRACLGEGIRVIAGGQKEVVRATDGGCCGEEEHCERGARSRDGGARVLDFGPKNRKVAEIRPFRLGPVNVQSGQNNSASFEFPARPMVQYSP